MEFDHAKPNEKLPRPPRDKKRRVLLKISGEGFAPPGETGVNMNDVTTLAQQIADCNSPDIEIAVVIGGGNLLRGAQFSAGSDIIHEATAHYMGMLATVINGLALQDALEHIGTDTRLMTAIRMDGVAEPFIRRRCERHLQLGRVVILACGTGNPFCTTDSAAALRACEIGADVLLKATKVDGVYNKDPKKHTDATRFDFLTYRQVMEQKLKVMDMSAIGMCMDNNIPIFVFDYQQPGALKNAIDGLAAGTLVANEKPK